VEFGGSWNGKRGHPERGTWGRRKVLDQANEIERVFPRCDNGGIRVYGWWEGGKERDLLAGRG
jgi:hypothetical protein